MDKFMTDNLKNAINELQYRIDKQSDTMLLIFDNVIAMDVYIRRHKEKIDNLELPLDFFDRVILMTIEELSRINSLSGRRFGQYHFYI